MAASCTKTEDVIVQDNVPPPDKTIDSATIDIYINKAYINITGREPIGSERSDALTLLKQNNFSIDNRKQFIATLFTKPEYIRNQYNTARLEYLQSYDSSDIESQIFVFSNLLTQPQYAPFYDLINYELRRLDSLKKIVPDMYAGKLDYRGMLKRIVNNYFYDQVNMGTENFVVSTFQNFLFRYPSDSELESGKIMVDGNNAILFLEIGNSKDDYVNIFFNTPDYYEGQVRYIFKKFLFREPTPAEIAYYGAIYKQNDNYQDLQKEVFSLNEYAGL